VIIMPASHRSFLIGLFTAALALTPTVRAAQKSDTDAASELSALTGQLRIGTEFFLNRTETKESMEKHFRLMRETGITLVRVFIIWDDIERTPNNWNFEGYDWIYDAAAENGIKIVATLCAEDPPGWVKKTPFYHNRTNLNDSVVRTHAATYIQKVVNRYKNHPAQGVWLLANEPIKYDTEPATFQAFGEWLKAKYGTLDELNKHWFEPLDSFSDVTIVR
jgi:beta-galactosidase